MNHSQLSLLNVIALLQSKCADFNVSTSHHPILSKIRHKDLLIAGIEVAPLNPLKCHISDSLLCIPVQNLRNVQHRLESESHYHCSTFDYCRLANDLIDSCIKSSNLLCVADHVWLELDSAPTDSLSLFLGSTSASQSTSEVNTMFFELQKLLSTTLVESLLFKNQFEQCFQQLVDIKGHLTTVANQKWMISEIGIMMRHYDAHLKVLLSPAKTLVLAEIIPVLHSLFSNINPEFSENFAEFISPLNNIADHACKLSLSIKPSHIVAALEIKPTFDDKKPELFFRFCNKFLELYDSLYSSLHLPECPKLFYIEDIIDNTKVTSRMHHFKIPCTPAYKSDFKYYRDIRTHTIL